MRVLCVMSIAAFLAGPVQAQAMEEEQFDHAISACMSWMQSEAEFSPQGDWSIAIDREGYKVLLNRRVRLAMITKAETVGSGADEVFQQKECSVSGFELSDNPFIVDSYAEYGFDLEDYWKKTPSFPQSLALRLAEEFALSLDKLGDYVMHSQNTLGWEALKCDPETMTIIGGARNVPPRHPRFPFSIEFLYADTPPTMFSKELAGCVFS